MSQEDLHGLIELGLVFGVIGLALWELRSLRRAQRDDKEQENKPGDEGRQR